MFSVFFYAVYHGTEESSRPQQPLQPSGHYYQAIASGVSYLTHYNDEILCINNGDQQFFFKISIIMSWLALSASFEYLF